MEAETRLKAEGADYGVFDSCRAAVQWLREAAPPPARARVIGDDDCDGVTSAHILLTSLRRLGYEVETVIRPLHTIEDAKAALEGEADVYLIADAGSSFLRDLDEEGKPVLVLDHHTVQEHTPQNVFEVNPRRAAGDRTWQVSASVVTALFALALDPKNADVAYAGAAGGIADRQHLRGFTGLLGACVDAAVAHGTLRREEGLTLTGRTMLDAIGSSVDPYFPPSAADPEATRELLAAVGVEPGALPAQVPPGKGKALAKRLEATYQGVAPERVYPVWGERLPLRHPSGAETLFHLTRLLEAVTAAGQHRLALMLLAGSPDARAEAQLIEHARARRIQQELTRLRSVMEERPAFRHACTHDAPNTGVYAHVLLTYVYGDDRPVLVSHVEGERAKVSARGSPRLFLGRGLDLSIALPEAARAAGGHGGGHPGAAGANVPRRRFDEFLGHLEAVLRTLGGAP